MHLSHPQEKEAFITTPSPSASTASTTSSSLSLFYTADSDLSAEEDDYPLKPGVSSATFGTMMSALSPVSVQSPSSVFMMKEAVSGQTNTLAPDTTPHNPSHATSAAQHKSDDPFDADNYPTDFDSAFLNLSPTMGMGPDDGLDGIPLFNAEEESAFSSFLDNVALDPNFIFEPNLSDTLPKWPETQKPRSDSKFTKFGNSPGLDLLAANSPDAANIHERLLKHESKDYRSPGQDYPQSDSRAQALAMAETQGFSLKHKESRSSLSQPAHISHSVTGSSVTTTRPSPQTSGPSPVSSGTSASSAPMGLHFGSDPAFGGSGFQPSNGTPALKKVRGFEEIPAAIHEGHGHVHMQPQRMVTGLEGVVNPKLVVAAAQMSQGVTDQDIFLLKRRKSDNMAASQDVPHDIYAPMPHLDQIYSAQQHSQSTHHMHQPPQQHHMHHVQLQPQQQQQHQQQPQHQHQQHQHQSHSQHQQHLHPQQHQQMQQPQQVRFGDGDGDIPMGSMSATGIQMNPSPSMLFPDKDALADSYHQQHMMQHGRQHSQSAHNPPPHHPQHQGQQTPQQQQQQNEQSMSASPTPGSPNLTEDQKRMNHISSEKRRRDLIKQEFEEMCGLVPRLAANSDEKGKRRHGHRGRMPKDSDKDKDTGTKSKSILLSIVYDYMVELVERNKTMRSLITEKGGYHADIANALHPPKTDD